jgi:poly-gamma-glutamate system protein
MRYGDQRNGRQAQTVYALAGLSLVFLLLAQLFARRPPVVAEEMRRAAVLMKDATEAVRRCREARGIPIDPAADINRTGFIGLEASPITTSLGNLEAKRTSANPNFAGLLVLLLHQAGVRKGDTVAVGASSSFPALITAALSAARSLELRPLFICSLGASQWGANHPEFTWLDIGDCLNDSGVLPFAPIALSLGGEGDTGLDMSPAGRVLLARRAAPRKLPFLTESSLERNVAERMRLYREAAAGKGSIAAFINIGGGYANMGTDSEILKVGPGLASFGAIPPAERRGVIFEMGARRIPVIHLLYIKGLCERFRLPWDPQPLPPPGEGEIFQAAFFSRPHLAIIAGMYFAFIASFLLAARLKSKKNPPNEGLSPRDGDFRNALV